MLLTSKLCTHICSNLYTEMAHCILTKSKDLNLTLFNNYFSDDYKIHTYDFLGKIIFQEENKGMVSPSPLIF